MADACWTELEQIDLVVIPVGSLRQHGRYLPLNTDTVIAIGVAEAVTASLSGSWVAPAVEYGAGDDHQASPGTSSVGTDLLHRMLVDLVRSMGSWSRRVLFVNAHEGNLQAVSGAVGQLVDEGHDVAWATCAPEEVDLRAGRAETSLMLLLRPNSVRIDPSETGGTRSHTTLLPALVASEVRDVSGIGALGYPTGASAKEGALIFERLVRHALLRAAAPAT